MQDRLRCAVLAAALALAVWSPGSPGASAQALDTPVQVEMEINHTPTGTTFTAPGEPTTPSFPDTNWDCDIETTSTTYTASCAPTDSAPSGQWTCPSPIYAVVSVTGPGDSVTGTASCAGGGTGTCTATGSVAPGSCLGSTGLQLAGGGMPFVCVADFSDVALAATSWKVRCGTGVIPQ